MLKHDIGDLHFESGFWYFPCQDGTGAECQGDARLMTVPDGLEHEEVERLIENCDVEPICGGCGK